MADFEKSNSAKSLYNIFFETLNVVKISKMNADRGSKLLNSFSFNVSD